ncbi:MAG: AraC family transcriptional regulator [Andreesenia angusta]|nr:AraC family transcriptional regulator [Andreesenia angusta]
MFEAEQEIIKSIYLNDEIKAKKRFEEIINNLSEYDLGSYSYIRAMKNYLISLNTLLYQNFYCRNCKKEAFKKRNSFMKEIELASDFMETYDIGFKMIEYYIYLYSKNSIKTDNQIINDILCYINSNSSRELELGDIAKKYNMSTNYLSTIFKEYVGESFSKYLNIVRIKKAKDYLLNTNNSILEISIECGFNSQSYFNYVFKKLEGISPGEYRKISVKNELAEENIDKKKEKNSIKDKLIKNRIMNSIIFDGS